MIQNSIKARRLLTFLLFAVVPFLTSCGAQRIIVNGLDEREANEIIVFLNRKGIDATKVQAVAAGAGGNRAVLWNVQVSEDRAMEAMALLSQEGLPRRQSQNLLGIFSTSSLVPSEMQEQIRYQAGLAEQLASNIRKIDGILDAEVLISFPKEDPLNPGKMKGKITASVYVKHNGVLDDPNSHLSTKIKRYVASSITGLDYDNVTVIPDRARTTDLTGLPLISPDDRELVSVWSITVGKDSVTRFRIIFFAFLLLILLLISLLAWIGWKVWPLIQERGGLKQLFTLHPLGSEVGETKKEKEEKTEAKKENDQGQIDRDIDET